MLTILTNRLSTGKNVFYHIAMCEKHQPKSVTYRNWIWNVCCIALKTLKGIDINTKPKELWKEVPDWWPSEEKFFDPRNTRKAGLGIDDHKHLLAVLLECCYKQKVTFDNDILTEISAWNNDNLDDVCRFYKIRNTVQNIVHVISTLSYYKLLDLPIHFDLKNIQVKIKFEIKATPERKIKIMHLSEALRYACSVLCKIYNGKDPKHKIDNIWTSKPPDWPDDIDFRMPSNTQDSKDKFASLRFVRNLINICELKAKREGQGSLCPSEYKDIVSALTSNDFERFILVIVKIKSMNNIRRIFMQLYDENLLQDSIVCDKLRDFGITYTFSPSLTECPVCTKTSSNQGQKRKKSAEDNGVMQRKLNFKKFRNSLSPTTFGDHAIVDSNNSLISKTLTSGSSSITTIDKKANYDNETNENNVLNADELLDLIDTSDLLKCLIPWENVLCSHEFAISGNTCADSDVSSLSDEELPIYRIEQTQSNLYESMQNADNITWSDLEMVLPEIFDTKVKSSDSLARLTHTLYAKDCAADLQTVENIGLMNQYILDQSFVQGLNDFLFD